MFGKEKKINYHPNAIYDTLERNRKKKKKLQIEELEKIVRLKNAEADMFQLKADEAKREAERLQMIALAKQDKYSSKKR